MDCVIPAYNAESTIAQAIESARLAGASSCLVVDDGSSDRTAENARRAGAYVISQANAGASVARRVGLQNVRSDFVVLLDADDRLEPGIMDALRLLQASEGYAVVGGRVRLEYANGNTALGPRLQPRFSTDDLLAQPVSPWPPAAAVWRTQLVRAALEMSPAMLLPRYAEDYELLVRASRVGEIRSVSSVTCTYAASGGKSHEHAEKSIADAVRIQNYYASHFEIGYKPWSKEVISEKAAWRRFRTVLRGERPRTLMKYIWKNPREIMVVSRHIARVGILRVRSRGGGKR